MKETIIDTEQLNPEEQNKSTEIVKPIPGVSDRVRAAVTDSIVMIVLSVIASQFLNNYPGEFEVLRGVLLVLIFGLYDPLLTALIGGTIGHRIMGLRVRRQNDESKNIPIHVAIIRYALKVALGVISLLIVSKKSSRHAIHDIVVKSVVVYA
ncbi:MAG: putative RDD family membrane protein YckC [Bacteroidia bacterium]|jgi:uncharacterized RDD family membrane protein YckC